MRVPRKSHHPRSLRGSKGNPHGSFNFNINIINTDDSMILPWKGGRDKILVFFWKNVADGHRFRGTKGRKQLTQNKKMGNFEEIKLS